MSDEAINIKIKLREGRLFAAETRVAAKEIDNLGDAAERAERKAKRSGAQMTVFGGILGQLERNGNATGSSILEGARNLSVFQLALLAAAPAAVAMAGVLIALAGSAGAAALGLGALGAGAVLTAAAGLGGLFLIARDAADGFKKIDTALESYNQALAMYGIGSKQAMTAQSRLNAVVEAAGGAPIFKAVQAYHALGDAWERLTKPAQQSLAGVFMLVLATAHRLLPTLAEITNLSGAALDDAVKGPLRLLSGGEVRGALRTFGQTFAAIIAPLSKTIAFLFLAFVRVARVAAPYLIDLAFGAEHFAFALLTLTGNAPHLTASIAALVGQLATWGHLAKVLVVAMALLLGSGAIDGQRMVVSLTAIVQRFNDWARTAAGQREIHRFFTESAALTSQLASVLGELLPVIRASLPALTGGLSGGLLALNLLTGRLQLVTLLLRGLGPLAGPAVTAFVGFKAAGLAVATVAPAVRALTAAMVVLTAATTANYGVTFALSNTMIALRVGLVALAVQERAVALTSTAMWAAITGPVGLAVLAIAAVAGAFYLAYTRIGLVHTAVDAVFGFITKHWPLLLAILTGPFGLAVYAIVKHLATIKAAARDALNFVIRAWDSLHFKIPGFKIGPVHFGGVNLGLPHIPLLGDGGIIQQAGAAVIGERGPELLRLPAGARVDPLPSLRSPRSVRVRPVAGDSGGGRPLVVHVHSTLQVSRKVLAKATSTAVADELAGA